VTYASETWVLKET